MIAAAREGSLTDRLLMTAMTLLTALPSFVTGPLLVLIFALKFGWAPVSGMESPRHLILP